MNHDTSQLTNSFPVLAIVYVAASLLRTRPRQVRRHIKSKIRRLAKFIDKSAFIMPLVVDDNNVILLGNARFEALKLLGIESIPVIRVSHLDEGMIRALIIADNQFTVNADWYKETLREELLFLQQYLPVLGLVLIDLGFETPQLDLTFGDLVLSADEEAPAAVLDRPSVTKLGDVIIMGVHKLICGDARHEKTYQALLGIELAVMVFGDVPYNVKIDGPVCGNGAIQHKEFVMGAGEMTREQFIAFMAEIFTLLRKFSSDGSIHMQCMDWRHGLEILTAAEQVGYDYINMACWVKHSGGMGSLYRSQHELIHIFKSGKGKHINNVMLGKYGRNRTNVWQYDGANSFSTARRGDLELHSTTKSVDLVADAIMDCSNRDDVVLDPTAGSGTTLIAAERTGRVARLIELDPFYCDVIVRRWQKISGQKAVFAATGRTFDETESTMEK